jgi:hypothetical protein
MSFTSYLKPHSHSHRLVFLDVPDSRLQRHANSNSYSNGRKRILRQMRSRMVNLRHGLAKTAEKVSLSTNESFIMQSSSRLSRLNCRSMTISQND